MLGVFSSSKLDLAPPFFLVASVNQTQTNQWGKFRFGFCFENAALYVLFFTDFGRLAWSLATTLSTTAASSSLCCEGGRVPVSDRRELIDSRRRRDSPWRCPPLESWVSPFLQRHSITGEKIWNSHHFSLRGQRAWTYCRSPSTSSAARPWAAWSEPCCSCCRCPSEGGWSFPSSERLWYSLRQKQPSLCFHSWLLIQTPAGFDSLGLRAQASSILLTNQINSADKSNHCFSMPAISK